MRRLLPGFVLLALDGAGALSLPVAPVENQRRGSGPITVASATEGLTLRLAAACGQSRSRCPFLAEIHGRPAVLRMIDRVDYSYVPDQRTPARVADPARRFRFEGAQYPGELVYADVMIMRGSRARIEKIPLAVRVPFAAPVSPDLPRGLRFEDKYQRELLEGTPSDYHQFRIWLRGDPTMQARIQSVEYHLPEAYFSNTRIKTTRATDFYLEGGASERFKWDIVAVVRWRNGDVSTHRIPFRPQ